MKNSRRIISFITALAVSSSFVSCKKTEDSSQIIEESQPEVTATEEPSAEPVEIGNEYKVYVVCILTDDMIGENEDYDIKLSVKGIENGAKLEGFDVGKELILTNIPSNRKVKEIEGEFAFTTSQKNINMQTSVLQGEYGKSK